MNVKTNNILNSSNNKIKINKFKKIKNQTKCKIVHLMLKKANKFEKYLIKYKYKHNLKTKAQTNQKKRKINLK